MTSIKTADVLQAQYEWECANLCGNSTRSAVCVGCLNRLADMVHGEHERGSASHSSLLTGIHGALTLIESDDWQAAGLSVAGVKAALYRLDDATKEVILGEALALGWLKIAYMPRTHSIAPGMTFESFVVR